MPAENDDKQTGPAWKDLASAALKFLVFLAIAFVLIETALEPGERPIDSNRVWVIIVSMMALLLLLAIDRLRELSVSPTGVKATLSETKAKALEEIGALEDQDARAAARNRILQAKNETEISAAREMAVELNVNLVETRVRQAISERKKIYVRYRAAADQPVEAYLAAPLDLKLGETVRTQDKDYLWVHSYKHGHIISLLLERVLGVEISTESFELSDVSAEYLKDREWNVPRPW